MWSYRSLTNLRFGSTLVEFQVQHVSDLLMYCFRYENNGQIRVLVPEEASLSVMKGAVIFGRQPSTISAR